MADRVTCCPHCSTSFRITDAQLQTAKGAVRCGSCLQIFRALDHLLPLPEVTAADTEITADADISDNGFGSARQSGLFSSSADAPDALTEADTVTFNRSLFDDALVDDGPLDENDFDLDEDILIFDDMGHNHPSENFTLGELSEDFLDGGNTGKLKGSLFDRELKVKEVESDHSDESWAEELLQEIETEDAAVHHARPASDIFKGFGERDTGAPHPHVSSADPLSDLDDLTDEADGYRRMSTGSFSSRDDTALDDDAVDAVLGESFSARKEPLFSLTGERDAPATEDPAYAPTDERTDLATDAPTEPRPPARSHEHDLLLQGIAPAPVEMHWHVETSPWPKRLLWGGLSLLACLALVAQFAYFNFDQYSRTEPWRGAYASLCPIFGCTLPSLSDPRRVKAYNLVVRSNPQAADALIIDSILLNTASFEQPFPDFALTFTNLQGKQLAYRRFTPREYLGGEMAGATLMPSGQPVHISLEIVDPGADAVNYTATIPLD